MAPDMLKSERQGKHMLLHLAYRAIVFFAKGTVASCGDVHHPTAIVVPKRTVMPLRWMYRSHYVAGSCMADMRKFG